MSSSELVVFKDYPLLIWLVGVMTVAVGTWVPETAWERLLFALIGVAIIGFTAVLTVTADRTRGTLNLHYRSLFCASTKAYLFREIVFVKVAEDWEGERMYRVELILCSGEVVPLRSGYSVGKARKERRAQQLRSVLRIDSEVSATGICQL